jgi:TetR/AcrR family transcriptional regulator
MEAMTRAPRPSADATRARILEAAAELFADHSFDGASTREIAARAEVTQPLLNYHFHSKDELWRSVVDGLFARLDHALTARVDGLRGVDPTTTAKLVVREFVTWSARNPQLHRIMTQETKADGPRMDYLVDHHVRTIYERTVAMLTDLVDAGAIPDLPMPHLYYLLTGAAPTMFVLGPECRRLTGLDPTDDAVIEAHADAVCTLFFGAP